MFSRSHNKSFSKSQKLGKVPGSASTSFSKDSGISKTRRHESSSSRRRPPTISSAAAVAAFSEVPQSPASPIITLVIGRDQRIFAAHEEILCASPFFQQALQNHGMYYGSPGMSSPGSVASPASPTSLAAPKRIVLPEDEPEIFSCVLEYLYKGDYYPRLIHNKRRNSWELERAEDDTSTEAAPASIYTHPLEGDILKDTVIYCTADRFGLDELKRIALRKQGLQSGIPCSTILSSARFAYAHTPDTDSKLRAHYLALIIRSRSTFKRSGTMQLEMYNGGSQLFFDLFVALCNHVDDISTQGSPRSNRF